jgi:hypothetical protein
VLFMASLPHWTPWWERQQQHPEFSLCSYPAWGSHPTAAEASDQQWGKDLTFVHQGAEQSQLTASLS